MIRVADLGDNDCSR
jgi:hypothetical protein